MSETFREAVLRMNTEGRTGVSIARELGCSGAYVSRVLRNSGKRAAAVARDPNAWTDERVELLKVLWAEGMSFGQIAKALGGPSRNAITSKVYRLGLPARVKPSTPGERRAKPSSTPRRARLRVAGKGAVFTEAEGRPVKAIVPEEAWIPLAGSSPKPWTERGFGCKWPIDLPGADVQHSCCEPVDTGLDGKPHNYCPAHRALGRSKASPSKAKELQRVMRRFAA